MKLLNSLTPEDILASDYNTLISIVEETNRAPGGYLTVQAIANACFLNETKRMLEIGTSTGNTAIEIARMCRCHIESIDINERSVIKARQRAEEEGLSQYINATQMDATNLSYDDNSFDVVFCGNVTSLIPNKEKAFHEYVRVLKHGGLLAAVPMYYIKQPSSQLLEAVSAAIQLPVQNSNEDEWLKFYRDPNMVLKYRKTFKFEYISDENIELFVNYILEKPHLKVMQNDTLKCLAKSYREFIYLFRDNLSHMGYSILLYSKELFNNEPELFTGLALA